MSNDKRAKALLKNQPKRPRSVISGSNAARRIACPGSWSLEKDIPKEEQSEYAQEGTALHEVMEEFVKSGAWEDGYEFDEYEGKTFHEVEITDDLSYRKLYPAKEALDALWEKAGGFDEIETEFKFRVSFNKVGEVTGVVDVLALGADGRVYVIDYKFGDGVPVPVERNAQLMLYAAGVRRHFSPGDSRYNADEYVIAIIQPRSTEDEESALAFDVVTGEDLDAFREQLSATYDECVSKYPPFEAGDHCRWCLARATCEVRERTATQALTVQPRIATPAELSRLLQVAEVAQAWSRAVFQHAEAELMRGVPIPGYKLVDKRAMRRWEDEDSAERTLARLIGKKKAYKRTLVSPAQAEKLVGKHRYQASLSKHVSKRSSGQKLAPDTDPRPDRASPLAAVAEGIRKLREGIIDG